MTKEIRSTNDRNLTMKTYQFTAQIEKDAETGLFVGVVPNLPDAHTQGATLDELQRNLQEVVDLCLDELTPEELEHLPEFVGVQQVTVIK